MTNSSEQLLNICHLNNHVHIKVLVFKILYVKQIYRDIT